jgi:hypothetical protein
MEGSLGRGACEDEEALVVFVGCFPYEILKTNLFLFVGWVLFISNPKLNLLLFVGWVLFYIKSKTSLLVVCG